MSSLFDRLGGESALEAVVDAFYVKVLSDPSLKDFFGETQMKKQKRMQKKFLTYAFGGPVKWDGRSMKDAHAKARSQGLNESHFNSVAGHLQSTLQDFNVPESDIEEVMKIAGSVKSDIVDPDPSDSSSLAERVVIAAYTAVLIGVPIALMKLI